MTHVFIICFAQKVRTLINTFAQNKGVLVPTIILASKSESRRKMLEDAGLSIEIAPARIDEEMVRQSLDQEGASPRDVADTLAEHKAQKVQDKRPDAVVIGSDQVLALKGKIFGKPKHRREAAHHLLQLQGQQHVLFSSAVVFWNGQPVWRSVKMARLRMHSLGSDEIDAYLSVAWPGVEGSVGAYHAEGYGARLFSHIEGDWFAVMGLPLLDLLSYFRQRGWLT